MSFALLPSDLFAGIGRLRLRGSVRAGCGKFSGGNLEMTLLHSRSRKRRTGAFTLVEVLATMMLMSIVLPSVNQGIATATLAASTARHRTEAAGLARSKLSELITNGQWQGGVLSGDCTTDWPDYRWQATLVSWPNDTQAVGLQQLDVQILWKARSRDESVTVSGLVYVRPVASS